MDKNFKKNINGYSIIEVIIYLAIFTAISVLVINSFITILASFNTTSMNRRILESGTVVMERMSREIRQAKTIDVGNSSLDNNLGVLQLNSTDGSGNAIILKFVRENNGELNFYKDGSLQGNLLGSSLTVMNLTFNRIVTTHGEAVRVIMTLQYLNGKSNKSENFYDTIVLRGNY